MYVHLSTESKYYFHNPTTNPGIDPLKLQNIQMYYAMIQQQELY